jgi:hypothetical protein
MAPLSVLLTELFQVGGMGSAVSGSGAVSGSAARGAVGGRVPFCSHVVVLVLFMPRGHAHDMALQAIWHGLKYRWWFWGKPKKWRGSVLLFHQKPVRSNLKF